MYSLKIEIEKQYITKYKDISEQVNRFKTQKEIDLKIDEWLSDEANFEGLLYSILKIDI